MTHPDLEASEESPRRAVFISYATGDRKQALSVCQAVERRGTKCWMSLRDVAPGENYQEAIVRSLRDACAVVLVFSGAANKSDEIKKELSLASRFHVPVIALRIEEVEPSDAFAYELSTRQWIDAFNCWDKSIDSLVGRIQQLTDERPIGIATPAPISRGSAVHFRRLKGMRAAAAVLFVAVIAAACWWWVRATPAAAHSMTVRLAGFRALSPDLPATLHDTIGTEIVAAFNADGVIGVSTASAPPPGSAPAYALGGTIHRIGDSVRVITQFTNERTGVVLWSDSNDYPATDVTNVPHRIGIDAGTVIRCGLFGASTYPKTLPDSVLRDYLQYCQQYWAYGGNKTLVPAQRVVAAVPDFSWGWSAVANGFMQAADLNADSERTQDLRASGLRAEAKALTLDRNNSEALAHKAYLIDPHDWVAQEALFKSAIAAKPLDCGCEHYGYGLTLRNVGRVGQAIEQFRAATDMLALWPDSQIALASSLVTAGKLDDATPHLSTAVDLSRDSTLAGEMAVAYGTETGDYPRAISALRDPRLQMSAATRAAILTGYQALASGDSHAKAKAVAMLVALAQEDQSGTVATLLGALGANHEALAVAAQRPWLFWYRSMRGALDDPTFPALATRLRLMNYWKTTHTQPDVCRTKDSPLFCRMISTGPSQR